MVQPPAQALALRPKWLPLTSQCLIPTERSPHGGNLPHWKILLSATQDLSAGHTCVLRHPSEAAWFRPSNTSCTISSQFMKLFATLWTVAWQSSLSIYDSRQNTGVGSTLVENSMDTKSLAATQSMEVTRVGHAAEATWHTHTAPSTATKKDPGAQTRPRARTHSSYS